MAQTRRRRTKHRGNAAGIVESRGRTGRKPTAAERKSAGGASGTRGKPKKSQVAADKRAERLNSPPTWRGAFNRALVATAIMFALWIFLLRPKSSTSFLLLAPVVLAIYTPMGYYIDLFGYRRRQRKKAQR